MKIIIDIPEEDYEYIKNSNDFNFNVIKNGIPLSEGHWIYTGDCITEGMLKCSECDFEHDVSERFLYCPNCGTKMSEIPTGSENDE